MVGVLFYGVRYVVEGITPHTHSILGTDAEAGQGAGCKGGAVAL